MLANIFIAAITKESIKSSWSVALKNDLIAINRLLAELTNNPRILDESELLKIVTQENLKLVLARDIRKDGLKEPNIVGMSILHWIELPTKINAYIDDVVVLPDYRGQKIGEEITNDLIFWAKNAGAKCIDLTSAPKREAANRLYQKLGFVKRETNVYRLNL